MDGTLLSSREHLSEANVLALQECARRGIALYVATARPQRIAFRPREIQQDVPFLTEKGAFHNGAVTIDRPLGYVKHRPLSAKLVHSLVCYLVDMASDLQIVIQNGDDYQSFRLPMDEAALTGWGFSREELLPFSEASQRACSKIVVWHKTQSLMGVYRDLVNRYGDRVNAFLTSSDRWLMLTASNVSKEDALLELLSLRGIRPEEVVVFGDEPVDIGMFRTFGCSIAMANAPSTVKDAATYVTRSNDDDGVAFALDEYLRIL